MMDWHWLQERLQKKKRLQTMVHSMVHDAEIHAKKKSNAQMKNLNTMMLDPKGTHIRSTVYNFIKQLLKSIGSTELPEELAGLATDATEVEVAPGVADAMKAEEAVITPKAKLEIEPVATEPAVMITEAAVATAVDVEVEGEAEVIARAESQHDETQALMTEGDNAVVVEDGTEETLAAVGQQTLKSNLREKLKHFTEWIPKKGKGIYLGEIFTEVYITEEDNREYNLIIGYQGKIPDLCSETPIKIEDIFKPLPGEDLIRTVMTIGVAGVGKTVNTQRYALDWAEEKANQDICFMFPFTFNELNKLKGDNVSLMGLLHYYCGEIKEEEICSFKGSKVVFIFDGLDEFLLSLNFKNSEILTDVTKLTTVDVLLTNLLNGTLLPSAHIWITTRPGAAVQIPSKYVDRKTEMRGFTDTQKEEYFMKSFSDKDKARQIYSNIKTSPSLHTMCEIPVFCWTTAAVQENMLRRGGEGLLPLALTEFYLHYFEVQLMHDRVKYHEIAHPDRDPESFQVIMSLGKLAFEQLKKGNLIFYEEDLTKCGIDTAVYSGVLTAIYKEECGLHDIRVFCFVHLSVQEFLAALYVFISFINDGVNLLSKPSKWSTLFRGKPNTELKHLYQSAVDKALQSQNGHLDLFLRFLLGLSLETNRNLLQRLRLHVKIENRSQTNQETVEYIKKKIRKNPSPERSINLFYCLIELNEYSLMEVIEQYLSSQRHSIDELSPAQWSAIIFLFFASGRELYRFDPKYSASEEEDPSIAYLRLSSDEVDLSSRDSTPFSPRVYTEHRSNQYSFQFPGAGLFQCSQTGLKFGTTEEGEVVYRTVQWGERCLQSAGRTPAGPLFSIECAQEPSVICQLHLPHCDITPGDALSVAHITDEGMTFLETVKVTKTHVVVNVTHLSNFGLTWLVNWLFNPTPKPTDGQVLLFRQPPREEEVVMTVFLLPKNVPIKEVEVQHETDTYIATTSHCKLTPDQVYSLHCPQHEVDPKAEFAQPYHLDFGPNFHPSFDVFMDLNTKVVSLELQGPENMVVWRRDKLLVKAPSEPKRTNNSLSDPGPSEPNRTNSTTTVKDKRHFFVKNRPALVRGVKNVESIVDELLSKGFHEEMAAKVDAVTHCDERVRRILDSVTTDVLAEALFLALLEHEEPLMMELLGWS